MTSCGNDLDHCVQIVGYGESGSTNYWKVRNSWGTRWGESGHMRLKIGSNLCGINHEPTAVTVSSVGPSPPAPTPAPTPPTPTPAPTPTPTPTPGPHENCHWLGRDACESYDDCHWC